MTSHLLFCLKQRSPQANSKAQISLLHKTFSCLEPVERFPPLAVRYTISFACSPLHHRFPGLAVRYITDFLRLQSVTWFPALRAGFCFGLISLWNINCRQAVQIVRDLTNEFMTQYIIALYFTWNWNGIDSTYTLSWLVLSGSFSSYQIMLACWSRECENRPSFQTLSEELFNMQKEEQPYVNVDPSQALILPPTAGRGMKQRLQIEWRGRLYV